VTPEATAWHLDGEHGISSRAIFDRLTFGRTTRQWGSNHPADPDDFRRCQLLLRAVPEFRARLSEMAAESPEWARLVERWDDIHALIEADVPGYLDGARGNANRAYHLMTSLTDKVPA
jgi:hypothetical protein